MVKRLPAMWERVRSLGREDPLEKEMANHSSTLAWKIQGTEEPQTPSRLVGYSPWGRKELDMTDRLHSLTEGACWPLLGRRNKDEYSQGP